MCVYYGVRLSGQDRGEGGAQGFGDGCADRAIILLHPQEPQRRTAIRNNQATKSRLTKKQGLVAHLYKKPELRAWRCQIQRLISIIVNTDTMKKCKSCQISYPDYLVTSPGNCVECAPSWTLSELYSSAQIFELKRQAKVWRHTKHGGKE